MAALLIQDSLPWQQVWAPYAGPCPCHPLPTLPAQGWLWDSTPWPTPMCRGQLLKVPAVAFRHSPRVVVAEPVCGSQEEVRTYSPAHMMSDLVLGK